MSISYGSLTNTMEKNTSNLIHYINISELSYTEFKESAKSSDRRHEILQRNKIVTKDSFLHEIKSNTKLTLFEELSALAILAFGVPGAVFSIPTLIVLLGYLFGSYLRVLIISIIILIPLSFTPAPFMESSLTSWISFQILKYFSFKVLFEKELVPNKPRILVAPPHGVFPFGNIITMIAFPSIMGFSFRGLASSVALNSPIFRQLLCTIGVIDAGRDSALQALRNNLTIGISTGGVAEVFETNSSSGDEVIVLKSRKGLVKLAIKTGAELVPCYLFGNTQLYSLWTGGSISGHNFLRKLSRKLGFALIIFWGRLGLPIPYRIPILGVMSEPIVTIQNDNPTDEEINIIHEKLLIEMIKLFDKYKHHYGWAHKNLVIE